MVPAASIARASQHVRKQRTDNAGTNDCRKDGESDKAHEDHRKKDRKGDTLHAYHYNSDTIPPARDVRRGQPSFPSFDLD